MYPFFCDDAAALWTVYGTKELPQSVTADGDTLYAESDTLQLKAVCRKGTAGVWCRRDTVTNTGAVPLTLRCVMSKFTLHGGEYEAYTQYNAWVNESEGCWQPLTTTVAAATAGPRTTHGAAPMLALWNRQTNRGTVFHLIPDSAWEMRASAIPAAGDTGVIAVEIGPNGDALALTLQPGESRTLPEILFYSFENKTDLDCHRLHRFVQERYPHRKTPPVCYNTWLYRFDQLDLPAVMAQVSPAAALGVEYFVIDAGWFGTAAGWGPSRGDWSENTAAAFKGQMATLADAVRAQGMQFGLWFEVEFADASSRIVAAHPDYFFTYRGQYFLDFGNPAAVRYLRDTLDALIDQYGIAYLKFDNNESFRQEITDDAFAGYLADYRRFIRNLREDHPTLYCECCASGGLRMDLGQYPYFDSFWLSDHQSPYEGLRIVKETMLRLPPVCIERWLSLRSLTEPVPHYPYSPTPELLVSCNDATWNSVTGLTPSVVSAFLLGGPIGLSCDLTALSGAVREQLRADIAAFKAERPFWQTAVGYILADTPALTVTQYSDAALSHSKVLVAAGKIHQSCVQVYPHVDDTRQYRINGETVSGHTLREDGITVPLTASHTAVILTLTAC